MELTLATPVQYVPRVGPAMASRIAKLGITTVRDFLYHIPFRYNDFSLVSDIHRVQPGETVTISGTVLSIKTFRTKSGKSIQEAKVADATGSMSVTWFNQIYLLRVIPIGCTIRLSGQVNWFGNKIVLSSPQYELVGDGDGGEPSLHTGRLVPVYSETEGVTSKWMRARIAFLLPLIRDKLIDPLPDTIRTSHGFPSLADALQSIHFPTSTEDAHTARKRLAFDELFSLQLRSWHLRKVWEATHTALPLPVPLHDVATLIRTLPFTLTDDQKQSLDEIFADISRTIPMNRLLEGDVGSGKTVVAAIAMYVAHRCGLQSVLMAPTQILAEQHYKTVSELLSPLSLRIDLVTGERKSFSKRPPGQASLVEGTDRTPTIIVGTHALLTESLTFDTLGLVVIDEQHRFGVEQRATLVEKSKNGKTPHFLTMTATPIPRTMARTIMGNIDLSVLASLPGGRQKIKTWVVDPHKRDAAYDWIRKQIETTGGQVFIVCPLIDESESLTAVKAVTVEFDHLQKIFSNRTLGLLHGRLRPNQKTRGLEEFRAHKTDILVTTPVVEVGIDIPNASIMMIEAAERFGLGQLHQLRGRVGRGSLQSYCLLFTEQEEETTRNRLKAMETIYSGPELAEVDLKLRGPGEIFGTKQHGIPELRIASFTDSALIAQTQRAVHTLTSADPELRSHPPLRELLKDSTIEDTSGD